jgi:hypothetical protein
VYSIAFGTKEQHRRVEQRWYVDEVLQEWVLVRVGCPLWPVLVIEMPFELLNIAPPKQSVDEGGLRILNGIVVEIMGK